MELLADCSERWSVATCPWPCPEVDPADWFPGPSGRARLVEHWRDAPRLPRRAAGKVGRATRWRGAVAKESAGRLVEQLREGLERLGLEREPAIAERLARLAALVCEWGRQINLSGHRTPEQVAEHLILDAAALVKALPPFQSLADLGSGAGFPGLPIAVLFPQASVYLVEARRRRHHFQRAAIRELAISNAHPLLGRIEALPPRPCSVALAQAVGPAGSVLDAILPWASPGGWLAVPASAAAQLPEPTSLRPRPTATSYTVPGGRERKVWLVPV